MLHAVFITDETGRNLLHYTRESLVDPDLVTSYSTALYSFLKETTGGEPLTTDLTNGLMIFYSTVKISESVKVKAQFNIKSANKTFIFNDEELGLVGLMKKLNKKKESFNKRLLDTKGRVHQLQFDYETKYYAADEGENVQYFTIWNKRDKDLEFLDGRKLVDTYENRIRELIIDNIQLIGKARERGKVDKLQEEVGPLLVELFFDCEDDRDEIEKKNPYNIDYHNHNPAQMGSETARRLFSSELLKLTTLYHEKYKDFFKDLSLKDFLQDIINYFELNLEAQPVIKKPAKRFDDIEEAKLPLHMSDEMVGKMKEGISNLSRILQKKEEEELTL